MQEIDIASAPLQNNLFSETTSPRKCSQKMRAAKLPLSVISLCFCISCAKAETQLSASASCPPEWKETISNYPYDDGRNGHIGYLLINPKFPREECYCEIHPKTLIEWYSQNQSVNELTEWIQQCYVKRV
tara:strand:+ start:114 stop:503 length:390 start_codon:yes stop_codon:yes gene_type:complete